MDWTSAGSILKNAQTDSGAHEASYLINVGGYFRGIKRPEHEIEY
jgi:hypothetical protein